MNKKYYLFITLVVLLTSFSFSQSNQQSEIDILKTKVSDLEKRLEKLENNNSNSKNIKFSVKWKNISNWRRLKTNMSFDEVENLLGVPLKVDGGEWTYWYYSKKSYEGRVSFYNNEVHSWDEPTLWSYT